MSTERCSICSGRGYFKRMGQANPPYFADDKLEKVECPDCVEAAVEVVEAALANEETKRCPLCRTNRLTPNLVSGWVCSSFTGTSVLGCGNPAAWTCSPCFANCWCQACYDKLKD